MTDRLLPRGITAKLRTLLASTPVVVLEGPRASGKTAIGSMLLDAGSIATTADLGDPTVLAAARASPSSFVNELRTPAFVDEAQLVPELLLAIKRRVDRDRRAGAFVLTGSSRLGRAQLGGSDPLAGRSARVRLWPMTQAELAGAPTNLVEELFAPSKTDPHQHRSIGRGDVLMRIRRGGIPNLAGVIAAIPDPIRGQLMAEYVEGVLQHEVGRRHDRAELERLFRYLAATTARLLNVTNVANELAVNRETLSQRFATLESTFLLHTLLAHRPAQHRALAAHPKVHAVDVGIAAWAARVNDDPPAALYGALVETFVVNELIAQAGWSLDDIAVRHWRDTARKLEVDAVLIHPSGDSVAVEVKAGSDIRADDLVGLRNYLATVDRAQLGVVFYTGDLVLSLDDRIRAIPISALWSH